MNLLRRLYAKFAKAHVKHARTIRPLAIRER